MASNGTQATQGQQEPTVPTPAPGPAPALDDEMLEASDSESSGDEGNTNAEVRDLKRQLLIQARQMTAMQELMTQMASQFMATPNEKPPPKPKMAVPEKYEGGRNELRTFLTNIDLYCGFNNVPNDQEKILMASTHMKGKAATWMQPYVEDFLASTATYGTRIETRNLFQDWSHFKEEMGRIFGEVDAKNQAEKAITRLKQTTSVSTYTAEFKQLQARIDWDDAALRTVFEAGLKENVKDGLVHHDKPESLHALVELATRIDNRLWERNEQKKRQFKPNVANMKKYRNKYDKDGDAIMTGKVQEKTKDRKPRGRGYDGLSKEERERRYASKACLRCGEVGHFRRDCPKNEVKQAAVKIGMLKAQRSLLAPDGALEDDNLSDLDLYDEARLADSTEYVVIPELVRADKSMKWEVPRPTDWIVKDDDAKRRMAHNQCWVCGDATHHANDCNLRGGRIAVTGPNAKEALDQASQAQPYFTDSLPTVEDNRETEHRKLHWVDCDSIEYCQYHKDEKLRTQYEQDSCCHGYLETTDCMVRNCHLHEPGQLEDEHCTLAWHECKMDFCIYHADAKEQCRMDEDAPGHEHLWASECPILDCHTHKEAHRMAHEHEIWINCINKCRFHREQRIAARQEKHHLHKTVAASECRTAGCRKHGTTRDQARVPDTLEAMIPHGNIHWSFCTDDDCMTHFDAKADRGHFPQKSHIRKGKMTHQRKIDDEGTISHRHVDWKLCYRDACPVHRDAKERAGRFPKGQKRSEKGRLSKPKN